MTRFVLVVGAALVGGCAGIHMPGTATVDDSKVARLPEGDRQTIVRAAETITVAEANVNTAEVAKDDAKQFCRIADDELKAATAEANAADRATQLGKQARDDATLRTGERTVVDARREVLAAQAKRDYCRQLVNYRDARVKEAQAKVADVQADQELLKARLVQNEGVAKVDVGRFEAAKRSADDDLARRRLDASQKQGLVATLRSTWEQRSSEVNRASREVNPRATRPPPPPAPLQVPPPPAPPPLRQP